MIAALHELKGTGQWQALAKAAGVDYTTISRIYHGDKKWGMSNPGILTVEKLATAIQSMKRAAKPKRRNNLAEQV